MGNNRPVLGVIVGSTRPGRVGRAAADWFVEQARADGRFEVELLDLAEVDLPLLDEPNHPRLGKYTKQHTLDWSKKVSGCDAFVIVTSEYNFSYPAALKNALDYLFAEWGDKPVALFSYGGVSAGLRAAAHLKETLAVLGMHLVRSAIAVPFMGAHMHDGRFEPDEAITASVKPMLDELARYEEALRPLRS